MNKILNIFIVFILFLLVAGCENKPMTNKTEFYLNEDASIDKINLKMTDYEINDNKLEITFLITNKRGEDINILADDYFKLFDSNRNQIFNSYSNSSLIKKNETVEYKLIYDITNINSYDLYFYSGIVENNIKFSFNENNISN